MSEKFWLIEHCADLTETGYLTKRTFVKTIWEGFSAQQCCEHQILQDWCRLKFGNEVEYVQGVAPAINWRVLPSYDNIFIEAKPVLWGGYKTETHQIVLGIGNHGKVNVHSDTKIS